MAISATTVWEVNAAATGGDASNGGGFDPGNASMATDLAATGATGTAPVVTSASYNFITRDNNTYLFIKAGTNWTPGEYPVTSTSGNAATLNAAVGAVRLYTNGTFSGLNTVAGCATTASPTGGTWAIDYSQSTTAAVTFTDLVIDGTTNTSFTSAGNPIGKSFIGNIISVTSGTGFTVQRIQINSVSGTTGTADKSLGTLSSTGGNGGLGGALISPGKVAGIKADKNNVFWKAGTYSFAASSNTAGGEVNDAINGNWIGYNTTRTVDNRDSTRVLVNASTNSRTLWQDGGGGTNMLLNIDFNANSKTSCIAVTCNNFGVKIVRCTATGFATGFNANNGDACYIECYTSGCTVGYVLNTEFYAFGCVASGGTTGFSAIGVDVGCVNCIATGCTTGFATTSGTRNTFFRNCSAYNCTTDNFVIATGGEGSWINCVAYGGLSNFHVSNVNLYVLMQNCAGGGSTTNVQGLDQTCMNLGFISLTANPYTNTGAGDYSLNTTAGGGALCRAAGAPATFMGLSTTASAPDIGAVQSAASAGGGGPVIGCGFIRGIGSAA